jgi:hypothetical protein
MPLFHRDGALPADPDAVFVFGSNIAGAHGGGAARAAMDQFGARIGVAEGMTGRAYAIPTVDHMIGRLPLDAVRANVRRFLDYAAAHPGTLFFVTRIGCGIAGFSDEDIAPMFAGATDNLSFAEGWRPWLA